MRQCLKRAGKDNRCDYKLAAEWDYVRDCHGLHIGEECREYIVRYAEEKVHYEDLHSRTVDGFVGCYRYVSRVVKGREAYEVNSD